MEKLIKILNSIKPAVNFATENELITNHVLDSMDIMNLVVQISDEFDVEITPVHVIPENFQNAQKIYELVLRLEDDE